MLAPSQEKEGMPKLKYHIFVCQNVRPPEAPKGCCSGRGSEEVFDELRRQVREKFSPQVARVSKSGCLGPCESGVNIVIYPEGIWYARVTLADLPQIVEEHLVNGRPVERLLLN